MRRDFVTAFFEAAGRSPDRVAIDERGGEPVSFGRLAQAVETQARQLAGAGVVGETVGLQMPRSAEFVVALIAIWAARKVALIMDPDWPEDRRTKILRSVCPGRVLHRHDIRLDSDGIGGSRFPALEVLPSDPAYLIFTSGSSGKPKGALLPHGGLCTVLDAQVEAFALAPGSRFCWLHGVAFDASLSDIGTTLLSGATLCFDRSIDLANLPDWWREMAITHVDLPPALLPYIELDAVPESLKTVIVGGQVCDAATLRRWSRIVRVVNVYGPTEATICTSFSLCDEHWMRPLIGRPIPGVSYSIDDSTGELSIAGEAVALGYFDDPGLTQERFSIDGDARVFHTRDRVKRHADGEIEFLGRLDRQLKVHGRLVHPEEIEAALMRVVGVRDCFVFARENGHLAACVAVISGADLASTALARHLQNEAPAWMVPAEWNLVESLPLTANGKPDRQGIEELFIAAEPSPSAATGTRNVLAEIFSGALLGREIGVDDPFHLSGGDSLAVLRALSIAAQKGIALSAAAIESYPTIRTLAAAIDAGLPISEARSADGLRAAIAPLVPDQPYATTMDPSSPAQRVLITGATGFLGSALLGELITRAPDLAVVCLVRDGADPTARVERALADHGFSAGEFECVDGDISQPRLGLAPDIWRRLSDDIDTVIQVAADVSLAASCDALWPANVVGSRNILDFLVSGRAKSLHFVSTLSVFVDARPLPADCLEDDLLGGTEVVFGGYAQSKWAAEILVRESCDPGGVAIYRPGLLTANSATGYSPPGDWFANFLDAHEFDDRTCNALTCDFTPVDRASAQIASIVLQQVPGTYHIATESPMSYRELKAIKQSRNQVRPAGFDMSSIALGDGDSPLRIFKTTATRISCKNASALLSRNET